MQGAQGTPAWKAILWILGVLLVIAALVYPFMQWRVEQRELECGQSCANKGFSAYRYTPPKGVRLISQDQCECVK
jgi:hypothetical protein